MRILSIKTHNSESLKEVNKKNKIISIIVAICITSAFLVGLYDYIIIVGLQEQINEQNEIITSQADTIKDLSEKISVVNNTNAELISRLDFLESRQQSYGNLLFYRFDNSAVKIYVVQSGNTVVEDFETTSLKEALEYVSNNIETKNVKFKYGVYDLDSDVTFNSKSDLILDGQNSELHLNGHTVLFWSESHEKNSHNQICNFNVYNGTFRLENSFDATFENINFENCKSASEVSNTNEWSEFTKFINVNWNNCQTGITLKSPTGNATPSYENTMIDGCSFNLLTNNSIGILVEEGAHFSNSRIANTRIWMHTNNSLTQTGLCIEDQGAMTHTILSGVTFETFDLKNIENATIYGIYFGKNCTAYSDEGISFLGNYTARISNLHNNDLPGAFRTKRTIKFDNSKTNSSVIHREPFSIESFDGFINITDIHSSEQVIVQISLNFMDHTITSITLPTFTVNKSYYELTKQDLYDLYPSQNTIQNIEVFAQTNLSNSETIVSIAVFGIAR